MIVDILYFIGYYFLLSTIVSLLMVYYYRYRPKEDPYSNEYGIHVNAMKKEELLKFYYNIKSKKVKNRVIEKLNNYGYNTNMLIDK